MYIWLIIFQITEVGKHLQNIDPVHVNELLESIEKTIFKYGKTTLTVTKNPSIVKVISDVHELVDVKDGGSVLKPRFKMDNWRSEP